MQAWKMGLGPTPTTRPEAVLLGVAQAVGSALSVPRQATMSLPAATVSASPGGNAVLGLVPKNGWPRYQEAR